MSDLRSSTLPHKVEEIFLQRLNRHLIPDVAAVAKQLKALKASSDVQAAASVARENDSAGDVQLLSLFFAIRCVRNGGNTAAVCRC